MLKQQQFKNGESDVTELRILRCQCIHIYNNKKKQGLDKYKDDIDKYVFLLSHPQKELNYLIVLSEKIKSLNHLI